MKIIVILFFFLLSSCMLKPPQVAPTFLKRSGEFSCNMMTGGRDVEMQVAVSPIKHVILIGEHKSKSKINNKTGERSSLGLGLYYKVGEKTYLEFIHMARQFDKFGGHIDQAIGHGAGTGFVSASGRKDFTQSWFTIYNAYKEGNVGMSLNYINTRYWVKNGYMPQFAQYYIRDDPFRLHAFNISIFWNVNLIERLSLYWLGSMTFSKHSGDSTGIIYTPISFRIGLNFYFQLKSKLSDQTM